MRIGLSIFPLLKSLAQNPSFRGVSQRIPLPSHQPWSRALVSNRITISRTHVGLRSTASLIQSDKLWVSIIFRITLHPSLTCLAPFIWVQVGGQYGDLDLLMGTSTRWQTSMPSAYFILVSMSTKSGQSVPISRIAASLSDVEPTTYNPWTDSRRRARIFRAGPCSSIRKIRMLKSTSRLTGESHATAKWMSR